MNKLIPIYLSLILVVLITSCQTDEEIFDPTPDDNSISAKINGEEFAMSGRLIASNYSNVNDIVYTLNISAAKPTSNGIAEGIGLIILSVDSTQIDEGIYIANSLSKASSGIYLLKNNTLDISASSLNTDVSTITVTAIDYDKKIVSGTFSYDAVDKNNPSQVYQVRDGVFKNISFE